MVHAAGNKIQTGSADGVEAARLELDASQLDLALPQRNRDGGAGRLRFGGAIVVLVDPVDVACVEIDELCGPERYQRYHNSAQNVAVEPVL